MLDVIVSSFKLSSLMQFTHAKYNKTLKALLNLFLSINSLPLILILILGPIYSLQNQGLTACARLSTRHQTLLMFDTARYLI